MYFTTWITQNILGDPALLDQHAVASAKETDKAQTITQLFIRQLDDAGRFIFAPLQGYHHCSSFVFNYLTLKSSWSKQIYTTINYWNKSQDIQFKYFIVTHKRIFTINEFPTWPL